MSDEDARQAIDELSRDGGLADRMQTLPQARAPGPVAHGQPGRSLVRGLSQGVLFAVRAMRRQPRIALTIVVTLALGIAVNMTAFTIVNGAALPPLPFEDASELVQLNVRNVTDARGVDISGDERPARRVAAAFVSWDAFSMLAQRPVAGRDFRESDDRAGAPPVVIIGWSLWQARYGGDQAIVGRTLRVNGVPSTIVGVMPEHFGFPYRVEFWLPLVALPESDRASRDAP